MSELKLRPPKKKKAKQMAKQKQSQKQSQKSRSEDRPLRNQNQAKRHPDGHLKVAATNSENQRKVAAPTKKIVRLLLGGGHGILQTIDFGAQG